MRFGVFELDCRSGDLRKSGIRMKLHEQPFRILKVLLERAGEVVSRDELRRAVWPEGDTFVDFDHGLNSAVNKLREVLGDSAGSARFIETVPRRGYRFVAPVELLAPEPPQAQVPEAVLVPPARGPNRLWIAGAIAVAAGVMAVGGWFKMRPLSEPPLPSPTPLTAYTGNESEPSFSPDGNQVAFVWDGPARENQDIYVKLVRGQDSLRLTSDPGFDFGPAWSPDGQWIAFARSERTAKGSDAFRKAAIFLIPPIGGSEKQIAEVKLPNLTTRPVAWMPDSRTMILVDQSESGRFGLWSFSTQTGMKRQITAPPEGAAADIDPAVSPDDRGLAFSRVQSFGLAEIYTIPLTDKRQAAGPEVRLTNEQRGSKSPVWTSDGRSIVFVSGLYPDRSIEEACGGWMQVDQQSRILFSPLLTRAY